MRIPIWPCIWVTFLCPWSLSQLAPQTHTSGEVLCERGADANTGQQTRDSKCVELVQATDYEGADALCTADGEAHSGHMSLLQTRFKIRPPTRQTSKSMPTIVAAVSNTSAGQGLATAPQPRLLTNASMLQQAAQHRHREETTMERMLQVMRGLQAIASEQTAAAGRATSFSSNGLRRTAKEESGYDSLLSPEVFAVALGVTVGVALAI
mmetsp:Transcript_60121/g.105249  ORF Transcript_60121/g.105249 Transcript_60121/m.105249 type:complete len:209 (-) Transcript_60121:54-680(-)